MKTFTRGSIENIINDIKSHPETCYVKFQIWSKGNSEHLLCYSMYNHKVMDDVDECESTGTGRAIAEDYNGKVFTLMNHGSAILVILKHKFPNIEFEFDAITNLYEEMKEVS